MEHTLTPKRTRLLQHGLRLEFFTVGWNAIEAVASIAIGLLSGSIALVGFGLDSVIESISGVALAWRLRGELGGAGDLERMESRALRLVAVTFFLISTYIGYEALRKLVFREPPEASPIGALILLISVVVMPLLARAKTRTAGQLGSRALLADAKETLVCAYLSATALAGVGLNVLMGWWWADPVAGLLMVPWIAREGWESWREASDEA